MIQPPSTRLPPIAKVSELTTTKLAESVGYLEALYRPLVRGSRRRRDIDHHDDDLRSDAFERTYAIRWLTTLISRLELDPTSDPHHHDRLIQQAASLLATCAGVAASGRVHRQFTFQLSVLSSLDVTVTVPIHVTLTDIPLDNDDYASVGAQTWGGACVLAEMIAEQPDRFGLRPPHPSRTPLRILELGAGTGLVGLTVAKVLQALSSLESTSRQHETHIVLTDFYPAVLANLQSNIDANFRPTTPDDPDESSTRVTSHPLDWSSLSMAATLPSTPFDLVFGADIMYEAQHAVWIRDCLESLLARPHPGDGAYVTPVFHLVIPQRPTHTFESSTVEEVFGRTEARSTSPQELIILEKESIVCEAYGDGGFAGRCADEDVEYVYYRIGWSH